MKNREPNTPAYMFQLWASFVAAVTATGIGIIYLPIDAWMRGFLGMGFVFIMGTCFSLAKALRDNQEAEKDIAGPVAGTEKPYRGFAPQ